MKIKSLLCRTDKRRESSRIRIETHLSLNLEDLSPLHKRRESSRIRIEKRKDLEIWFEKNKAKYTDEIYGDLIYENYNIAKQN